VHARYVTRSLWCTRSDSSKAPLRVAIGWRHATPLRSLAHYWASCEPAHTRAAAAHKSYVALQQCVAPCLNGGRVVPAGLEELARRRKTGTMPIPIATSESGGSAAPTSADVPGAGPKGSFPVSGRTLLETACASSFPPTVDDRRVESSGR
jgi:hypothetical protein